MLPAEHPPPVRSSARSRRERLALAIGVGLPAVVVLVMSLFARPEVGSLLVPVFGPWAGLLYGHSDCTMGNQAPGAAIGLALLGVVTLALVARARGRLMFTLALMLAVSWTVCWELAAIISVVNTTS